MKVIYRIAFNTNESMIKSLEKLGAKVDKGEIISVIYIEERDKLFRKVQELFSNYRHTTIIYSKFTKKEKDNAEYLVFEPTWINGYPMPDDDFGYLKETYDTSSYCSKCGTGLKQKSPFLLKGEPKWGKKDFLKLFWVEDEIFMKKSSYENFFKPLGIDFIPVLHYKTKEILDTVVQLKIKTKTDLNLNNYPYIICSNCKRKKYKVINRGFFPEVIVDTDNLIMRTKEYFGHDYLAFNYLIVHRKLYQVITKNKLKRIDFIPCAG